MGTKLNFSIIISFVLIFFFSCSTKEKNKPFNEEEYIFAYKKMVLYGCINGKTNNDFKKIMNKYNDVHSVEVAILFHETVKKADSLGNLYSKEILPYNNYGDLKGKTPIFSKCVSYAFSKKIDSIAKKTYKKNK